MTKEFKGQLELLEFGASEITPRDEFEKMLKHSLDSNTPLRVKCGIDPTGKDIHLGHLVPYRKMRQFQDLGHIGVVIVGDYTAGIGDPTGKTESRPPLTREEINRNTEKYMDQLYTVLDRDKTEIRFQSEWFKERTLEDILSWAGQTTVAKLLSHDTFSERLEKGQSLGLHELFYPVLQGIDSVYIKADVELGGTDQKFNVLMGRDYQRYAKMRPQVAMLLPIVTGTCGKFKMSKSLDNYIGILEAEMDKFGKAMSIPDELMIEWYQYLSGLGPKEFLERSKEIKEGLIHPNEAKKQLASLIVAQFHGQERASYCRQQFEEIFKKKSLPDDIPGLSSWMEKTIIEVMIEGNLAPSKKEARRLLESSAVGLVDGDSIEKITDPNRSLDASFKERVLKVGKRKFLRLI